MISRAASSLDPVAPPPPDRKPERSVRLLDVAPPFPAAAAGAEVEDVEDVGAEGAGPNRGALFSVRPSIGGMPVAS